MNEFDDKLSFDGVSGDPLERLVEAFVDQSVPMGPEAAVNRRLVAAMHAASLAGGCSAADSSVRLANALGEQDVRHVRGERSWVRVAVQQVCALAAAIAIVLTAALLWRTPGEPDRAASPRAGAGDLAEASPPEVAPAEADNLDAADAHEFARLLDDALDAYIKSPQHTRPDRRALEEMLAAIIRENPEFARSESWRRAQERLTVALEKPQVLSMGVSLLGTLSWTTYGRF